MFKRPIDLQQARQARENGERGERTDCESKYSVLNCLVNSRERNALRHWLKSSTKSKEKQSVQSKDSIPKTSPLQSIVISVEESASSTEVNPEVTFKKYT